MKSFKPFFYFFKTVYRMSLPAIFCSVCSSILKAAAPVVSLLLSARLIELLTDRADQVSVLKVIACIVIVNLFANLLRSFLENRFKTLMERLKDDFSLLTGQKMMKMGYGELESARLQDLRQQALLPILEWGTFEFVLNEFVPTVLASTFTIAATFFLVAEYSLLLMLPVVGIAGIHILLTNIKNRRFEKVMMKVGLVERKLGYYNMVTSDFSLGKDIRIFRIDKMLMRKIRELNDKEVVEFSRLFYHAASVDFWETIVIQIQVYLVYIVSALDLLRKSIGIAYFFQITGLFINFGSAMFQVMNAFVNLKARNRFLIKFMEFNQLKTDGVGCDSCHGEPCEVEFSHVSFGYESTGQEVVSDLNFVIPEGRTVAIVGENGSGKTTIAKLMSGFLTPSAGKILINGEELHGDGRKYVASVCQDFQLFAFPIRENIETAYPERGNVSHVLAEVGVLEEVQKMKYGEETFLFKAFEENGRELSFGQSQKLATARALFKNAGVLILDEPTSACDAKAEYEIYKNFRKLIQGKTALLISHRLWSCQFCDEIMVLKDKKIVERGTHEQLMAMNGGTYRNMFLTQSKYYIAQ